MYFQFVQPLSRNGWWWSERNKNMDLGDDYSVYTGYFCQLSVQGQSEVIRCISDFGQPRVFKTAVCGVNGRKRGPRA